MKKSLLFTRLIFIGLIMLFGSGWAVGQIATNVVISEVYGGGGNSGATYKNDYIELYNPTSSAISLVGWSVQYASSIGTTWNVTILSGSIPAYGFFLIQEAVGTGGTVDLPTPDVIGTIALSGTGGKVILANTTAAQSGADPTGANIIDKVGFGTTANGFETARAPAPSNTKSIERKAKISSTALTLAPSGADTNIGNGWDSNDNSLDFVAQGDLSPQNTSSSTEYINIIWTGATDNDWATTSNWDNGLPTAAHNITIPTGKTPIISSTTSANCFDLTLESTATLNIVSDATNSGSLIFGGTYAGSATAVTYQRYMSNTVWHMMGSPFSGQIINAAFLSANSIIGMKDYDEAADNWNTDYFGAAPNVAFSLGKGYAIKNSIPPPVKDQTKRTAIVIDLILKGTLNNATVNVPMTRGNFGWTLLSNPFTSAIAANIEGGANNLITANTAILDPSFTALYIWDQVSGYVIINHATGIPSGTLAQDYLQVGQGFFVKSADPAAGNFTMTPAMQSHQTATVFKSGSASTWAGFTLTAETSGVKASTQIYYQENMSRGLDVGYDAGAFKSNPNFSLCSRLVEDNGVDFGLQCLPADYENLVIPIGLTAKANDIVIFSASALNIPEEYAVVLEDRSTNTFTNLSDAVEYSIQLSSDIDGTGRFFVRTSFKSTLGIDNPNQVNPYQVFIRPIKNQLIIRGESIANTTAHIYSITGKLVAAVGLKQTTENMISFNENSGIYIVQISNEKGTYTQKFSWMK